MKSLRYTTAAVIALLMAACTSKDELPTYIVDESAVTTGSEKLSDHVSSIKIVPLETSDSLLIGRISGIRKDGDRLFVNADNHLMQFDMNGKFVKEIARIGAGPGELKRINNFDVEGDSCYILSFDKLVIKSISNPDSYREIPVRSGNYIRFTPDGMLVACGMPLENGNVIMQLDEKGDTILTMLKACDDWNLSKVVGLPELSDGTYIQQMNFSNDLALVTPSTGEVRTIKLINTSDALDTEDLNDALRQTNSKMDVAGEMYTGISVSGSHIFWISMSRGEMNLYIYDKERKDAVKLNFNNLVDDISGADNFMNNMMIGTLPFNESDDNSFISVIDPAVASAYIKENPNSFAAEYAPLENADDDANPAVIFINFK